MLIPAYICIFKDAAVRNLRHHRNRILQVPLMQAGFFFPWRVMPSRYTSRSWKNRFLLLFAQYPSSVRRLSGSFAIAEARGVFVHLKVLLEELGGRLVSGGSLCAPDANGV